jgi:hypothetical protein
VEFITAGTAIETNQSRICVAGREFRGIAGTNRPTRGFVVTNVGRKQLIKDTGRLCGCVQYGGEGCSCTVVVCMVNEREVSCDAIFVALSTSQKHHVPPSGSSIKVVAAVVIMRMRKMGNTSCYCCYFYAFAGIDMNVSV